MTRPTGDKGVEPRSLRPMYSAEKGSIDTTRCQKCFIILALAPRHDCMTVQLSEEEAWGHSVWSVNQVS